MPMKKLCFYLTILLTLGCKHENNDLKFYQCEFRNSYWNTPLQKWINNKKEALDLNLSFIDKKLNQRNLDNLYKTKAHYIFGDWVSAKDCSAEIKNDTLYITYKIFDPPEVESTNPIICLELNKMKYANYKELKVVLIRNE